MIFMQPAPNRFRHFASLAAIALLAAAAVDSGASAQGIPYRGPVGATTVQLPTFNFFAISTSVEVPDSGEGFLGGNSSSAAGSSQGGIPGLGARPFSNGALASTSRSGGVSVRATIHDFDAMDRALLGADFNAAGGAGTAIGGKSPAGALAIDSAGSSSLADIRRQQAAEDAAAATEAERLMEEGKAYEAAGKLGLAKIQYRMASRRATGAVKQQALANLQRLNAAIPPAAPSPVQLPAQLPP